MPSWIHRLPPPISGLRVYWNPHRPILRWLAEFSQWHLKYGSYECVSPTLDPLEQYLQAWTTEARRFAEANHAPRDPK